MPIALYQFALAAVFVLGITTMIQPHRQTRGYMQTLKDIELAGIDYIGAHCAALPDTLTDVRLQDSGHLDGGFNGRGVAFTWRLADHPVVTINARGNTDHLAFLAGRTLGEFGGDGSYSFIPGRDVTLFRAANPGYNLFAYDENDFSCN